MRGVSLSKATWTFLLLVSFGASARADMSVSTLPHYDVAFSISQTGLQFVPSNDRFQSAAIQLEPQPDVIGHGPATLLMPLKPLVSGTGTYTFDAAHSLFSTTISLTDLNAPPHVASTQGLVHFDGYFTGTLSANVANVSAVLTSPGTQSVLGPGNYRYTFRFSYVPVGPALVTPAANGTPDIVSGHTGAFVVDMNLDPPASGAGGPTPPSTPEPSTLLLALLALPVAGIAYWKKRGGKGE